VLTINNTLTLAGNTVMEINRTAASQNCDGGRLTAGSHERYGVPGGPLHDPTVIAYGEENRDWGGAFAVYQGLTESLPYHRLFNSPISEGAISQS
jgi:hypothetical protein